MSAKKYPIGTKIKYIGFCEKCGGNTGEIIKVYERSCRITLPHSHCLSAKTGSIVCNWSDIELLIKKNEQLLFGFMEE